MTEAERREKRREYQRQWRAAHPLTGAARERHNERTRKWRKNNPEKSRESSRKCVLAHREERRQSRRRWYAKTKATRHQYYRDYLASHPEAMRKVMVSKARDSEKNRLIDKCAKGWGCNRAEARRRLSRTIVADDAFLQALQAQATYSAAHPLPAPLPGGLVDHDSDARRGAALGGKC